MKFCSVLLLLAASALGSSSSIPVFGHSWNVPVLADWQVEQEGATEVLHMLVARGPLPGPRRPIQFAIQDMPQVQEATVEADIRPLKRSIIIVYAYQDEAHFNYAHLSTDTALIQPNHNGVFHVFGGERVRISAEPGRASFATTNRWYHVKLHFDGGHGSVDVRVDGQDIPSLHAVDLSLTRGKIGIGSFDETGDFKNVRVSTAPAPNLTTLFF